MNGSITDSANSEQSIHSLMKAISWRITGSIDTILFSGLFTSNLKIAATIGFPERVTKVVLYYLHERVWNHIIANKPTLLKKWLDRLNEAGHDCQVVAPSLIPKKAGERIKTDRAMR